MMTNKERIQSMTDRELAAFLAETAYQQATPWVKAFEEAHCLTCPIITYIESAYVVERTPIRECDFTDGKCPHGNDIEWWLNQPLTTPQGDQNKKQQKGAKPNEPARHGTTVPRSPDRERPAGRSHKGEQRRH